MSSALHYRVVFDLNTAGYTGWSFLLIGVLFCVLGSFLVFKPSALPSRWQQHPRASRLFALVFLGFSVLWAMLVGSNSVLHYRHLVAALNDGSAKRIEGRVERFQPMPFGGHSLEKFCVETVCFAYSDYVISGGFNQTASHGGPIRAGLPVRITYMDDTIVRLEVGEPP